MSGRAASRTAVLVCQGRAVAQGRFAVGRFDDPIAMELLRPDERMLVEQARTDPSDAGWKGRIGAALLVRQAESMAVRTVAVDDLVRRTGNPQLVLLGAGLDGRAWRMPEVAQADVFEVDHPSSQEDKRDRAADLTPVAKSMRFVPVDLVSADLGPALATAGHDEARPTTWVLEGVVPYLTAKESSATVAAAATRSASGSRLIVTYQLSSQRAGVARLLARGVLRAIGEGDPMSAEPRRSTWSPESVSDLLRGAGFSEVEDLGLAPMADGLGVPSRQLGGSRVATAVRRAS